MKGTATRLPTSRKAATLLLLACTLLYTPGTVFAQTAATRLPVAVPSGDATPTENPTTTTENEASTVRAAPPQQLWRPSTNPGDPISEQQEEAGQPYPTRKTHMSQR